MTVTATTAQEQQLKPVNSLRTTAPSNIKNSPPKEKQECTDEKQIQIAVVGDLHKQKENHVVTKLESLDASLAEELAAIRKKLKRLRLDKVKTEKLLNQRDKMLDMQMKDIQYRGINQKMLELEVDRVYRLKELRSYSFRMSSIPSMREKEQEQRITQHLGGEDDEESVGENTLQSTGVHARAP